MVTGVRGSTQGRTFDGITFVEGMTGGERREEVGRIIFGEPSNLRPLSFVEKQPLILCFETYFIGCFFTIFNQP